MMLIQTFPFKHRWQVASGKWQVILVITLLLVLVPGCSQADDSWQRVTDAGVLKVGLDPTYPPFEAADANGVFGLDVDLANALADDLGVETEYVLFGYDGLYDALQTGQVDVLISALVIIPERTKDFAYSDPYFNAGEILIVDANEADIEEMADLNGRSLAVELGSLGHVEATTWEKQVPNLTVIPYPTSDEAITAVANGEANAVLIDAISGRLFLQNQPGLKRLPQPVTVEPYAMVVRNADEQLLAQLNESLNRLQENGTLQTIETTWLGN